MSTKHTSPASERSTAHKGSDPADTLPPVLPWASCVQPRADHLPLRSTPAHSRSCHRLWPGCSQLYVPFQKRTLTSLSLFACISADGMNWGGKGLCPVSQVERSRPMTDFSSMISSISFITASTHNLSDPSSQTICLSAPPGGSPSLKLTSMQSSLSKIDR